MDIKYDSTKVKELKKRFIHFNHIQELQIGNEQDLMHIPQEYRFFMKNDRPYNALTYYNSLYFDYLNEAEGDPVSKTISDALYSISLKKAEEMKREIEKHNIMTPLLKRARATYQIDFDRNAGNKVTQSLLHIYGSAYENTECLYILKWIIQGMKNKPLSKNFHNFENSYGQIKKGVLLNSILQSAKGLGEFEEVLKTAYHKKMRHLCFHNAAELNDDLRMVIGIEDPNERLSYEEAFKSFYALQQFHNYIRLFATTLLIEDEDVVNEGIFSSATIFFEGGESQLNLLQLYAFYEYDLGQNKQLEEIYVKEDGEFYTFYSDKEILNLKRDSSLDQWFTQKLSTTITIIPAYPDIYEEGEFDFIFRTAEYGILSVGQVMK